MVHQVRPRIVPHCRSDESELKSASEQLLRISLDNIIDGLCPVLFLQRRAVKSCLVNSMIGTHEIERRLKDVPSGWICLMCVIRTNVTLVRLLRDLGIIYVGHLNEQWKDLDKGHGRVYAHVCQAVRVADGGSWMACEQRLKQLECLSWVRLGAWALFERTLWSEE